jgi:hypothetical protein
MSSVGEKRKIEEMERKQKRINTVCQHGIRKARCLECGGIDICQHMIFKYSCKRCKGKGVCEHGKVKASCSQCSNNVCQHGRRKTRCRECCGTAYCVHDKRRERCDECRHLIRKRKKVMKTVEVESGRELAPPAPANKDGVESLGLKPDAVPIPKELL